MLSEDTANFHFQSAKKAAVDERFSHITSEEEMETISKGFAPANTEKNTAWATKVFREWLYSRNKRSGCENQCPEDFLEKGDPGDVNKWLARFITEARRQDGAPYPPKTIHQILCGLQRFMLKENSEAPIGFLTEKILAFVTFMECVKIFSGSYTAKVLALKFVTPLLCLLMMKKSFGVVVF